METRIQYPFKNDHDIFIALIEDFNNSITSLRHQMAEDHEDTLEIKELLHKQYETLSSRIDTVEKDLLLLNPKDMAKLRTDIDNSTQWIVNFNKTKHIAWIIASTGFLLMGHYLYPAINTIINSIFGK